MIRRLLPYALVALVASALTWWLVSQVSEEEFRELQVATDSLTLTLERRDSTEADLLQGIASRDSSIVALKAREPEIQVRIVRTAAERDTSARHLREYLKGDSAGLALLGRHETATQGHVNAVEARAELAELRADSLGVQAHDFRRLYLSADSSRVALEANNALWRVAAEKWHLKANPPLGVRLLSSCLDCGLAGLAAGFASDDPSIGLLTGGVCFGAKELRAQVRFPF